MNAFKYIAAAIVASSLTFGAGAASANCICNHLPCPCKISGPYCPRINQPLICLAPSTPCSICM